MSKLFILEDAGSYVLVNENGVEISRERKTGIAMATAHDKLTGQFTQGNTGVKSKQLKLYTSQEAHTLTDHAHKIGKDDKATNADKAKAHEEASEAHSQQMYKNSKEVSQMARGRHGNLAKKHNDLAKYYRGKK